MATSMPARVQELRRLDEDLSASADSRRRKCAKARNRRRWMAVRTCGRRPNQETCSGRPVDFSLTHSANRAFNFTDAHYKLTFVGVVKQ